MAELRRINVCVPPALLQEVDGMVRQERRNRSEFIRSAVRLYLRVRRRQELAEQMRLGYQEMGELNIELATIDEADAEAWSEYERFLTECDERAGQKG